MCAGQLSLSPPAMLSPMLLLLLLLLLEHINPPEIMILCQLYWEQRQGCFWLKYQFSSHLNGGGASRSLLDPCDAIMKHPENMPCGLVRFGIFFSPKQDGRIFPFSFSPTPACYCAFIPLFVHLFLYLSTVCPLRTSGAQVAKYRRWNAEHKCRLECSDSLSGKTNQINGQTADPPF